MTQDDLCTALRTWSTSTRSAGIVAGVELMIQAGLVDERYPWIETDSAGAWLNFPAIEQTELVPTDLAVARIASSLAGWNTVLLSYVLEDLGDRRMQLVLAAIAAAAGFAGPGVEAGTPASRSL
jgi:hypothetical protein